MKRFLLWTIVSMLSLLFLAVIGLGFYTQTDHFRTWTREQLLAALRSSLNGDIVLERIGGSFWTGITFHNLSLRQNGSEVVSVPQGTLAFNLVLQLLSFVRSSTVHVSAMTLSAPVLTLNQSLQGDWNISQLLKPSNQSISPPLLLSMFINRLHVTDGRINIIPANGAITHLTTLSLAGTLAVRPVGLQVDLSTLSFGLARQGMPEVQWDGSAVYDTTESLPRLLLRQVELRTAQSHIHVSGTVQNLSAPMLALTVNVERLAIAELRSLSPSIPLKQDLSGTIYANGPLSALQVAATAQAPDGAVTTQFTAHLMQTPPWYDGTLEVKQLAIPQVLQLSAVSGEVTGTSTFTVTGMELEQGNFQGQIANLSVRGQAIGTVATRGTVNNHQVSLTGAAQGTIGEVRWEGQIGLGQHLNYDLTLKVRNLDAARVAPQPPPFPATLNFDASIKGSGTSLKELESALEMTLLPSRLGPLTDIHGQFVGSMHDGQLTVNTLSLVANDTTVTAQGKLADLHDTAKGTLTYSLQTKDLAPWLALFGQSGNGAVSVQGSASGTLEAVQIEGNATLANLHLANSSLQDGTVTYSGTGIGSPQPRGNATATMKDMNAGIHWQTATLTLALTSTQPLTIQTNFVGLDQEQRPHRVKSQIRYAPESLEAVVQEISLQLPTGTWRNPQPARFFVHDQTVSLEHFLLQRGDHALSVDGVLALRGVQHLQVHITRLPLDEVRMFFRPGLDISGHISADVLVQGTAALPEISANVTTSAITVAGQTYTGLTSQVTYRQEQLQCTATLRQDDAHSLSIDGGIPLSLSWAGASSSATFGEADLRIRTQGLSLAFLNSLSKDVQEVQGLLRVDAQVRGPLSALAFSGNAQLQDGRARVAQLGVQLTDLTAEALLTPDGVQLSSLRMQSGDGMFTGSGTIGLPRDANAALDLTLRMDNFQIVHTRQYVAALSGRLRASGSVLRPVLHGEVTVQNTTLRPAVALLRSGPPPLDPTITVVHNVQDLTLTPQLSTTSTQASVPTQWQSPPGNDSTADTIYDRLELDIAVTIPHNTWVHMEEGSIEFMGDVRARKAAYTPVTLVGTLETVRGWYNFHERKFRVEQGQIRFSGLTPLDPNLDIVARYTLSQYRVDVVISGTVRFPEVTLRSEPALEQADILSLLIFGKPTTALNAGEKVSLQSQALQTAAGYIASDLRRSLAQELGIDNLEFDVGQTLNQSRIGAGKYLTENIFVSTSQQTGETNSQEFSLEYYLDKHWQIKASTTTRGNDGIDILWQKRN